MLTRRFQGQAVLVPVDPTAARKSDHCRLNNMVVNAHVNQADVTRLSAGQEVEIRLSLFQAWWCRESWNESLRNRRSRTVSKAAGEDSNRRERDRSAGSTGDDHNLTIPVAASENAVSCRWPQCSANKASDLSSPRRARPMELESGHSHGIADYDYRKSGASNRGSCGSGGQGFRGTLARLAPPLPVCQVGVPAELMEAEARN